MYPERTKKSETALDPFIRKNNGELCHEWIPGCFVTPMYSGQKTREQCQKRTERAAMPRMASRGISFLWFRVWCGNILENMCFVVVCIARRKSESTQFSSEKGIYHHAWKRGFSLVLFGARNSSHRSHYFEIALALNALVIKKNSIPFLDKF